jgi:hypothetical protein
MIVRMPIFWSDFNPVPDERAEAGHAAYGSASLLAGPASLVIEGKDYKRFAVIRRADGRVPLNNPPSLTREHIYTLLSRNSHNIDPDDEVGGQAELTLTGPSGWTTKSGDRLCYAGNPVPFRVALWTGGGSKANSGRREYTYTFFVKNPASSD